MDERQSALLEWINSFSLQTPVASIDELQDGEVLWQMLRKPLPKTKLSTDNIDPDAFAGSLPTGPAPQKLERLLAQTQETLSLNDRHYELSSADISRLANTPDIDIVVKFLRLVLLVMLDSPGLSELVERIQSLSPSTQQVVGVLMQEMVDWETTAEPLDQDLRLEIFQLEERYASIIAQLEKRNREYREVELELERANAALDRSQQTNDTLTAQMTEQEASLRTQRSHQTDQSSVRELESQLSQREELISQTESSLTHAQSQLEEMRRENRNLQAYGDEAQKYQDEIDVLKLDLETQTRKANTADKYMAKLQNSQAVEKERDSLRRDLDNARERLLAFEKLRLEHVALQKSNEEASRTLSQIEQEHEELRMTKKQLRTHYDALVQEVASLNDRAAQDQELIQELRDRQSAPTVSHGGLDGELAATDVSNSDTKTGDTVSENSRVLELETELAHFRQRGAEFDQMKKQLTNLQNDRTVTVADVIAATQQFSSDEIASVKETIGLESSGEEYVTNLERELKLMSSAFHSLSRRLQMNNVTLLRRADVPHSWLAQQRKAVEGPVGLTR